MNSLCECEINDEVKKKIIKTKNSQKLLWSTCMFSHCDKSKLGGEMFSQIQDADEPAIEVIRMNDYDA